MFLLRNGRTCFKYTIRYVKNTRPSLFIRRNLHILHPFFLEGSIIIHEPHYDLYLTQRGDWNLKWTSIHYLWWLWEKGKSSCVCQMLSKNINNVFKLTPHSWMGSNKSLFERRKYQIKHSSSWRIKMSKKVERVVCYGYHHHSNHDVFS